MVVCGGMPFYSLPHFPSLPHKILLIFTFTVFLYLVKFSSPPWLISFTESTFHFPSQCPPLFFRPPHLFLFSLITFLLAFTFSHLSLDNSPHPWWYWSFFKVHRNFLTPLINISYHCFLTFLPEISFVSLQNTKEISKKHEYLQFSLTQNSSGTNRRQNWSIISSLHFRISSSSSPIRYTICCECVQFLLAATLMWLYKLSMYLCRHLPYTDGY